jgi:DNA-binding response OmpR family regulator
VQVPIVGSELVLLNIMMPRMNGLDVLQALREKPLAKPPRIVMYTAAWGANIFEMALSLGAIDFLHRPHSVGTLTQVVREVLDPAMDDHRQRERARFRHVIDGIWWADCTKAIDALRLLSLGRLELPQRQQLRRLLLEAAHKHFKELSSPKKTAREHAKLRPEIDPALTMLAIANAL